MYQDSGSFAEGYAIGRDTNNNGYNNGLFGGDWAAWIIILLIFGWGGNNGFGGFGGFGGGNGGANMLGYELGKVATTNDIASGFNNSAVLSSLNDLKLGQAGVQQTLCQGFSGVNATVNTVANQINQGICNLGYTVQGSFNSLSHQLSDCCCTTQRAIDGVNYGIAKSTCDIIQAGHNDTQRILDFLTGEKISSLQAENAALTAQLSNNAQTRTIVNELRQPCPIPAYVVPNPNCCYNQYNNGCCGL